jgi:hypothetical protein
MEWEVSSHLSVQGVTNNVVTEDKVVLLGSWGVKIENEYNNGLKNHGIIWNTI